MALSKSTWSWFVYQPICIRFLFSLNWRFTTVSLLILCLMSSYRNPQFCFRVVATFWPMLLLTSLHATMSMVATHFFLTTLRIDRVTVVVYHKLICKLPFNNLNLSGSACLQELFLYCQKKGRTLLLSVWTGNIHCVYNLLYIIRFKIFILPTWVLCCWKVYYIELFLGFLEENCRTPHV